MELSIQHWLQRYLSGDKDACFSLRHCKDKIVSKIPDEVHSAEIEYCSMSTLNIASSKMKEVEIVSCTRLKHLMALPPTIRYLYIKGAPNLENLPVLPETLEVLEISATSITKLPKLPRSLRQLWIIDCPNIAELPDLPESVKQINISGCTHLDSNIVQQSHIIYAYQNALLIKHYQSKKRQITRFALIKKELIEAQFHPKRVQRWVELGFEDW